MNRLITAIEFLTVFKIRRGFSPAPAEIASSMAVFPLAGALQGAILAALAYPLGFIVPWGAASALMILALALTNAGLHLDGLADTVDGLSGGDTPDERLRIMKDSSTGALGAAGVAFVLIIKYAALREAPEAFRLPAVFLMPVAGRWAVVPMAYWSAPARKDGGLGATFAGISFGATLCATILACAFFYAVLGLKSIVMLLIIGMAVYMFTLFFKRRLGGVTGDVFGFQSEVAEALFLLVLVALAGHEFFGGAV